MCEEYPENTDPDIIASKVLIIGRTYAAALERGRKIEMKDCDDFYYKSVVSDEMMDKWIELDKEIKELKENEETIEVLIKKILKTHNHLINLFKVADGDGNKKKERRSLASKYLHFHVPERFFIYDERARRASVNLIKSYNEIKCDVEYDKEYKVFYERIVALQNALIGEEENRKNLKLNPREIDDFLLWYYREKIKK